MTGRVISELYYNISWAMQNGIHYAILILLLPFRVMVSEIYNPTAFLENHINCRRRARRRNQHKRKMSFVTNKESKTQKYLFYSKVHRRKAQRKTWRNQRLNRSVRSCYRFFSVRTFCLVIPYNTITFCVSCCPYIIK